MALLTWGPNGPAPLLRVPRAAGASLDSAFVCCAPREGGPLAGEALGEALRGTSG